MLDTSFLANNPQGNLQTFIGNGDWQIWNKPRGYSTAQILCVGAGAGGGFGGAGVTGAAGGGSGALSRLAINLMFLPDVLYIRAGAGGAGSAAGAGTSGMISYVSNQSGNTTAANIFLASGHTAAVGGASGGTSGGAAEVIATAAADCILSSWGNVNFIAGVIGAARNAGVTSLATIPLTGGAGGGATSTAGKDVTGAGLLPTVSGGAGGASPGSGGNGITLIGSITGFMACGGAGGGGTVTASVNGGNGGNGGMGCGGGGGGNSNTGTPGTGGSGGNGLVIIQCF